MDICTSVNGLKFPNPLIVASGPMTGTADRILEMCQQGVGGIVTKTIRPEAAEVLRPCITAVGNMLYNCEDWSEYSGAQWLENFLPAVRRQSDTPLIASVGYNAEDFQQMIPYMEEHDLADVYECALRLNSHSLSEFEKQVSFFRKLTKKPVWVKLSNSYGDLIEITRVCRDSGADGVVLVTAQGPQMLVDIEKRRTVMGIPGGFVFTSGATIKNTALAYVNMVREAVPDITIIGNGGACTADDIIEFLLAGADAVQLLTVAMLKGRDILRKIIEDLPKRLAHYGFASVDEVRNTPLGKNPLRTEASFPVIDRDKCVSCGMCVKCCSYNGLFMRDKKPVVDPEKCFGCGQCQSRCPAKAITNVY